MHPDDFISLLCGVLMFAIIGVAVIEALSDNAVFIP